ncbi:hypothetical protein ABMA28_011192 [Loxostege sticticalis]|uniref:Peptidase S1 domain-containing protein n=1 Tax=Loxostege sticticalis TaxID=481309 RepID=A0ABD0S6J6_LOXSC
MCLEPQLSLKTHLSILQPWQSPVPLARNIRHLPCISRRTGQEGLCMFAIDCLKANGSHLGTCIDRFYFGSCCQIPDKTILPQIIGNNIEDNSIDSANFVHPQTEDKVHSTVSKIPDIFPTRKTTTEKATITTVTEKSETVQDRTEPDLETKTDGGTTIDDKNDVKLTTLVETTTKYQATKPVTEIPVKLSTFQTVSGESNPVTEVPKTETTEEEKETPPITTTTKKPPKPLVTRKPVKPTYKPRPTYRPTNFTRPQYSPTTVNKPRPTKPPLIFNITRKPPYKPPPKRPTTKKPLPSPPRLNITIIPQSTSTRPIFTRPITTSITYINTTAAEEKPTTTTTLTTTTEKLTTTTEKLTTTTEKLTTTSEKPTTILPTERVTETAETVTETSISSSTEEMTERLTEKTTTTTEASSSSPSPSEGPAELPSSPESSSELPPSSEAPPISSSSSESPIEEQVQETSEPTPTEQQETTSPVTEKETIRPATQADIPAPPVTVVSTEYPALVTWSTVDGGTKAPENITTVAEDTWSPITPPDGWVLISTVPPTSESTTSSSTTTTTTTTTSTTSTTTTTEQPTTVEATQPIQETTVAESTEKQESVTTTSSTSTTKPSSTELPSPPPTTQGSMLEFTVNVTLSPTVPTSTASVTTQLSSVTENVTESAANVTEADTTTTTAVSTDFEQNLLNFGKIQLCGRRLWPQGRIVGGQKSAFGQWPWQISLRQYRTSTYLHKCGAALLNENWAITAAHCVEHVPPSELLVRLGEHDLANDNEPYGFAERRVQIIASHPHFDPATFEYDLALLRFYEPVTFQPNILPVCVPDNDDDYVGKTAYVTGWGRLYDDGPLPSVLQEVRVPVINNSLCEAMYQDAGYNEHIPNIFICAGRRKGGADSCEGDSGGPMVVQRDRDSRFVLGGVISWGIGCAEPNQPGVYTRISEFRDWINQILQF